MATERQLAANRLNARKSTGPRSRVGKQRASRNAYRHGLSLTVYSDARAAQQIEELARQIIDDQGDHVCLQLARTVAEEQFALARIRRTKVAMIERIAAIEIVDCERDPLPGQLRAMTQAANSEPDASAEAIRLSLPELLTLERYERRAISRRDSALRKLAERNWF